MKRGFRKAQIATEYIIIMGFILLVIIPLFYYAIRESNISMQLNQANDAVNTLAKTADTVYSIGPGTKKYVWINMPGGVQAYSTANKTALIKLYAFGGQSDIFAETKADLAGIIPVSKGPHRVMVEMLESGYVRFGEANDSTIPEVIWTSPSGTINYYGIVLRASTNEHAVCKYDGNDTSYSIMSDPFVGSALTHERDLGIFENGTYTYYVRCQDPRGNIMQESAIINFTIVPSGEEGAGNASNLTSPPETNDTIETDSPVISLISPENNHTNDDGVVLFEYNVTDASTVWYCQLMINSIIDQTNLEITKNITQNFTKPGINYGNYSWNVNCTDVHMNKNSSEIWNFSVNYTQDAEPPVVNLVSPPDETIRNYWLTSFGYNTSDASSGIDYCDLHMNGLLDDGGSVGWNIRDTPVAEDELETIALPLFRGNYTWNISCADDSYNANEGYSETWNIRINISAGEDAFLDSCAGYCGYNGHMDGICRQNAGKCNDYTGGVWESEGDQYCPTQTGDFCCCAQQEIT